MQLSIPKRSSRDLRVMKVSCPCLVRMDSWVMHISPVYAFSSKSAFEPITTPLKWVLTDRAWKVSVTVFPMGSYGAGKCLLVKSCWFFLNIFEPITTPLRWALADRACKVSVTVFPMRSSGSRKWPLVKRYWFFFVFFDFAPLCFVMLVQMFHNSGSDINLYYCRLLL